MPTPLPDQAALGRAVQAIRTERGMSQVRLAEASGVAQTWISQIEHGRRNLSWSNVLRITAGLGVRLSELVERAETLG
jgi:transcriptional regulator with XRE-family HTH domain